MISVGLFFVIRAVEDLVGFEFEIFFGNVFAMIKPWLILNSRGAATFVVFFGGREIKGWEWVPRKK